IPYFVQPFDQRANVFDGVWEVQPAYKLVESCPNTVFPCLVDQPERVCCDKCLVLHLTKVAKLVAIHSHGRGGKRESQTDLFPNHDVFALVRPGWGFVHLVICRRQMKLSLQALEEGQRQLPCQMLARHASAVSLAAFGASRTAKTCKARAP